MATVTIDIPADGAWHEIMPASGTAYCVVTSGLQGVVFQQAAALPAPTSTNGSSASYGDTIAGSLTESVYAKPMSQSGPASVVRHDG